MNNNTNKMVFGIERLSTIFRAALWEETKRHGLSPLQAQLLLFIASHARALNNVSMLAKEFAVTKATVSDAVRVLLEKKLLKKQPGDDGRAFSLLLTPSGKKQAQELSEHLRFFDDAFAGLSKQDTKKIWEGLLLLMNHVQKTGIIPLRMCFSCQHYSKKNGESYCHLLMQALQVQDTRLDCPEHKALAA